MEDYNINATYPAFQASWMKGEYNITVRGEDPKLAMKMLQDTVTSLKASPATRGESVQVQSNVTCKKCNSPMEYEEFTSRNGKDIKRYKCTNAGCKTNGYRTSVFADQVNK